MRFAARPPGRGDAGLEIDPVIAGDEAQFLLLGRVAGGGMRPASGPPAPASCAVGIVLVEAACASGTP
jgi:hypothetical protein